MKKRLLAPAALFAALALLLPACGVTGASQAQAETIQVYRVVREDFRVGGELIRPETVALEDGADPLHAMLTQLTSPPADPALESALPEDAEILSYAYSDGEISLNLSRGYQALRGMDRTLADYCLTLTLTASDEVDTVSIFVEGAPQSIGLAAGDVVLYDTETTPYERQVRLYFADSGGRFLAAEYHRLTVGEDTPTERVVMEELLRGPYDEDLRSAIPRGTQLISVSTEDGLCTVNLSGAFLDNRPDTALGERLAVYAVVNSLTSLSDVDSVQLLIDGAVCDKYLYMSLLEPLERSDGAIGPANPARGETDLDLIYVMDDGTFVSIPIVAKRDEILPLEQSAVEALFTIEPEPGFLDLFDSSDKVVSAETKNGVCTVILNREFFDSRVGDSTAGLAGLSIVGTLTALDGVDSVRLTSADGAYISLGSLELSRPLTLPENIQIIH